MDIHVYYKSNPVYEKVESDENTKTYKEVGKEEMVVFEWGK